MTPIVAAWVSDTVANRGFRILGDTSNIGWMMANSDCVAYPRPKLSVTFESLTPAAHSSGGALKSLYR